MVLPDLDGIPRVLRTQDPPRVLSKFHYGVLLLLTYFSKYFDYLNRHYIRSLINPQQASLLVWAFPFARQLLRESNFLSLPAGT